MSGSSCGIPEDKAIGIPGEKEGLQEPEANYSRPVENKHLERLPVSMFQIPKFP